MGSPLIAHQLIVTAGNGTGTGRSAPAVQTPSQPTEATEANKTNGISVNKEFLKNSTD